jgi:hypothetical protein
MAIYKSDLPSPERVLDLFRRGRNTQEIAFMCTAREGEIYNLLHVARENERKANDENNSAASTISEQTLAHDKDRRDVLLTEIQSVENAGDLADFRTSETPTDQGEL